MSDSNARQTQVFEIAQRVSERLARIDGVVAVALGGSWARGDARADSDLDIGIYYYPNEAPPIEVLDRLAQELDDRHCPGLVTSYGEWGPWINGGGWLIIDGRRVDWLYRDLNKVKETVEECHAGKSTLYHQPGHPHGFHSHIYMGELHYCKVLQDPSGALSTLKWLTASYPLPLKRNLIETYLWQADFALSIAGKGAARTDVYYVVGCLFQCVACLVQVLYALNERYWTNEKGSVWAIDTFPIRPDGFSQTAATVLAEPGNNSHQLSASLQELEELARIVRQLAAQPLDELRTKP